MDLLTISRLLGYASFVTTMVYLHCRRENLGSLPSDLSELALANRMEMADLPFMAAWKSLGKTIRVQQNYEPASMMVLHTWNQRLARCQQFLKQAETDSNNDALSSANDRFLGEQSADEELPRCPHCEEPALRLVSESPKPS